MVAGPQRSERVRIADRACDGGIVGRPRERRRDGLRIRQGEADRRGTESRREPQGDGQDVSSPSGGQHECYCGDTTGKTRAVLPKRVSSPLLKNILLFET